ncbi:MAG: tetratricopeptide repeat protein [Candidatus Omnitrophota bacterium]
MKKILIILFLLPLLAFGLSPFLSLILSSPLRDHNYREIIKYVIASEEARGLQSDSEIAKQLFYYAAKNTLMNPGNLTPYDDKDLGYLINGLVYCDYLSDILATLCAQKGIPARYCMLKDKDGVSPHTLTEILLDGKWRVFDAGEFCYYATRGGDLATLEDLSADPQLVFEHKRMQKIREVSLADYNAMRDNYARMFPLPSQPQRSSSKIKRITPFDRVGYFYYDLFGKRFLRAYQDAYLAIKTKSMGEMQRLYYIARSYHLTHRTEEAVAAYNNLIERYPDSDYSNRALLFLAVLYMDQKKDYLRAIQSLDTLVNKPENVYKKYAFYYLGVCWRELKEETLAEECFDKGGLIFVKLDPALAN